MNPPRRPVNPRDAAEALFRPAVKKVEPAHERAAVPGARELVTLKLDSEVVAHFQSGGPGWQERINAALLKVAKDAT
jgi:uncharacterized protein (DUF4415 family)